MDDLGQVEEKLNEYKEKFFLVKDDDVRNSMHLLEMIREYKHPIPPVEAEKFLLALLSLLVFHRKANWSHRRYKYYKEKGLDEPGCSHGNRQSSHTLQTNAPLQLKFRRR